MNECVTMHGDANVGPIFCKTKTITTTNKHGWSEKWIWQSTQKSKILDCLESIYYESFPAVAARS